MREKKVRRLPVLDKQGRLVGLLSISDIARRADEEYARGAAIVTSPTLKSPAWRLPFLNRVALDA
jgi:CBS domain-containing protein